MPELPSLPPVASQPLSVVLLARNAAPHLEAVLAGWTAFLDSLQRQWELIVVDDGSSDGSGELAEKWASSHFGVQVHRHAAALGEGAALRTALRAARQPLLFYTLCDPHYQPSDLGRLLTKRIDPQKSELEIDRVHLMSAARRGGAMPGALRFLDLFWRVFCRVIFSHFPERARGWLGWRRQLARLLVRIAFGVRYRDVACPFRLYRREIFARIPLQSDGPFVHVEILAKANYLGLVMGEEMPLEVGHYPPLPAKLDRDEMRQLRSDVRRVMGHPDFGAQASGVA